MERRKIDTAKEVDEAVMVIDGGGEQRTYSLEKLKAKSCLSKKSILSLAKEFKINGTEPFNEQECEFYKTVGEIVKAIDVPKAIKAIMGIMELKGFDVYEAAKFINKAYEDPEREIIKRNLRGCMHPSYVSPSQKYLQCEGLDPALRRMSRMGKKNSHRE